MSVLGVVMAGGLNTRFGDLKAFAEVGGERIVDRVIAALREAADDVVVSANDLEAYQQLGLPMRSDLLEKAGPLGGIHAALCWARERADAGILAVACDMPFPSAGLLRALRAAGEKYDAVLPESGGRRGVEPLFAYYSVACIPAIEAAVARDDRRMIGFHDGINLHRLPLPEVQKFGDPDVLFMNVNSREELESAWRIAEQMR